MLRYSINHKFARGECLEDKMGLPPAIPMTKLLTAFCNEAHRKKVMAKRMRRAIQKGKKDAAPPVPRMAGSVKVKNKTTYQYSDYKTCWVCQAEIKHGKSQHDRIVDSKKIRSWWFSGMPK